MVVKILYNINSILISLILTFICTVLSTAQTLPSETESMNKSNVSVFLQHTVDAEGIYYSDQGNYFISTETSGYLTLWDARSMRQLRTFNCKTEIPIKEDIQIVERLNQLACKCKGDRYGEVIKLFDLSGELLGEIEPEGSLEGFSLEQDVYFSTDLFKDESALSKSNLMTQKELVTTSYKLERVKLHPKLNWLIGIRAGTFIEFVDLDYKRTFAKIKTDKKEDFILDFKISADGSKLLVVYPTRGAILEGKAKANWQIFDIAEEKLINDGELPFGLDEIFFSVDSNHVYYLSFDDSITNSNIAIVRLFKENAKTGKVLKQHYSFPAVFEGSVNLAPHPIEDKVIIEKGEGIDLFDMELQKVTKQSPIGISEEYTGIQFYNNGMDAVIRNDRTIHLVNFQHPLDRKTIEANSRYGFIALAGGSFWVEEDTTKYWEDDKNYRIGYNLLDARTPDAKIEISFENEIINSVLVLEDGNSCIIVNSTKKGYKWIHLNLLNNSILSEFELKQDEVSILDLDNIILSSDENQLLIVCSSSKKDKEVRVFDINDKFRLIHTIPDALNVIPTLEATQVIIQKKEESSGFQYRANYGLYLYDLIEKKVQRKIGVVNEYLSEFKVTNDNQYLICAYKNKLTKYPLNDSGVEIDVPHPLYYPTGVEVSSGNFYVYGYNQVICYDASNKKEKFKIVSSADKGIMFYLPNGTYFTPDNQLDYVNFVIDNKSYPYDQFDFKYNRPDIILDTLGFADEALVKAYYKAYKKRLKKMGFTEEMLNEEFHLPEVNILNKESLPTETDSAFIKINLHLFDTKYNLDRINIWVNNVAVYGVAGISLRTKELNMYETELSIDLVKGINKIQVSALNSTSAESYKETFYISCTAGKIKPDLYLITIGESEFEDSNYNLTYAAKDAQDVANLFSKSEIYEYIFTKTLVNQEVTKENILELRSFLNQAGLNDEVMLFMAGHGVLDKDLDYFFATYDMDFNNPSEKGMAYEDLEGLLDGIKPLKKMLFIDACHSGEIDKEEVELIAQTTKQTKGVQFRTVGNAAAPKLGSQNTSELVKSLFTDLRRGTGATVISSAGGMEFAMEGDDWNNGLFTYCLINGIQTMEADLNKDGEIWLSELKQYVSEQVTILSNGKQKPTSRIENQVLDYRVW